MTFLLQTKFSQDCLINAIYEQVHSCRNITSPDILRKQAALHLVNQPHIFYEKVQCQLLEENESYQPYCVNIFNGIHWGELIITAALSHMWNMPITIIMAMKYRVIKLFHESETSPMVFIANRYHGTSSKCMHYAATELIVPDQNQVPRNATPYNDLVPINLTNQQEAQKAAISYIQHHTQDHILKEYHNISTGVSILKSEMERMNKWYSKLETMRESLVSQMEALGLEVSQSQNVRKTLLPTQETQTQPQDITEQETAITSITTPTTQTDQYTFPEDLHQFIQTTGKLNTQYHTDDYILTIQQSSTGEQILSIEQKAAATTNEPMTQLFVEDILQILNAPPQPPTSLTSLPGTDMIPVPLTSVPSNPQPGTSAQGIFSATDPQLPVPPPGLLQHAQDLLKRHEASKSQPVQQPIAQPSGLGKSRKKEEEDMEVIDDDNDYNEGDDGNDDDDNDDDDDDGQDQ